MDKILDKLYLGDLNGATNYQMLKKNVLSFVNYIGNHSYSLSSSWL